jgi:hypothetical protein
MSPYLQLVAAAAALGLWLALFFLGRTAGGAIHLLPLAALALVFWARRAPAPDQPEERHR